MLAIVSASAIAFVSGHNSTDGIRTGWEPGSGRRGTMDILWSCIATISACTWAALHLNVPASDHGWGKRIMHKLKWMAITILAPEFVAAIALGQRFGARESLNKVTQWLERSDSERGSIIKDGKGGEGEEEDDGEIQVDGGEKCDAEVKVGPRKGQVVAWTLTHAFFLEMGGLAIEHGGDVLTINTDELLKWVSEKGVEFPELRQQDIEDRSKADWLMKGFALIQISWTIIQCIGRAVTKLPTSELELATCAFVVCTFLIYLAWWYKPKDVQATVGIAVQRDELPDWQKRRRSIENVYVLDNVNDGSAVAFILVLVGFGLLFNAIHLVAWNFSFPTIAERQTWRTCSVITTAIPAIIGSMGIFARTGVFGASNPTNGRISVVIGIFAFVHTIARIIILIQLFLCLRSMPVGVYQAVDWAELLPHI